MRSLGESQRALGQRPLVEQITDQLDVESARRRAEQVVGRDLQGHAICRSVEGNSGHGEDIDIGRQHAPRPGLGRGDGDEPRAGAEVEHAPVGDHGGIVE